MRLEANESKAIGEEVRRLDPAAEIYLYGSRANDAAKGGDIDLLVVSDRWFSGICCGCARGSWIASAGSNWTWWCGGGISWTEPLAAMARETGIKL